MDFKALWDAQPDLIVMIGPGGTIGYANRSAQALGLRQGGELPELFPRAFPRTAFSLQLKGLTYHFAVLEGDQGVTVLTGRDVSELTQADCGGLLQKSELLASLLDQMGEGVVAADTDGRIVLWNAAAGRITNLAPRHLSKAADLEILDLDGNPCEAALARALRGEEIDGEEVLVRHQGGFPEGVWLTVTARPLRDEQGHLTGAVAVFRDSTGQRQLTESLGQARDAALQATRMKSEFLANMSHEIRTPLNGIIGLGELLGQTHLDQPQREYVTTVRLCSESLLSIVNNVLDFSKIEAGKAELACETFELEATVEEALELAATGLGDKPVEMYARLGPDLPRFLIGDPYRLRQILLNFLSNAIKFTSEGHVVVEVEKIADAENGAKLRFAVHDSGIGVETSAGERLFQPFSQGDSSSKRVHGGTGLGLVICRKLAEMMGGEAGFSPSTWPESRGDAGPSDLPEPSRPGGTTFFFTANLATVADRGFPQSLHDLPPLVLSLANSGLRDTMQEYLRVRGARVGTELTAGTKLLILDEEGDLRSFSEPPTDLRIIYLGRSRPTRSAGHLNFLRKPLKFSRLLRLLREVAGNAHDSGRRATLTIPKPSRTLKGRVLVAEDNSVNRHVLLLMLEKMGLQAKGAENGREAAEAALSGEYDLVLMDCQMPIMDGHEATRLVRDRWTSVSRLPIIAVTANVQEGEAERCRLSGMDDYLAKPITVDRLRGLVERWLSSSGCG